MPNVELSDIIPYLEVKVYDYGFGIWTSVTCIDPEVIKDIESITGVKGEENGWFCKYFCCSEINQYIFKIECNEIEQM